MARIMTRLMGREGLENFRGVGVSALINREMFEEYKILIDANGYHAYLAMCRHIPLQRPVEDLQILRSCTKCCVQPSYVMSIYPLSRIPRYPDNNISDLHLHI